MLLTLQQAADRLGRSRRQVRYLIKNGKLRAAKHGGQWRVDEADLPRTPGQSAAAQRKQDRLVDAVEETLALPPPGRRRRYSLKDLRAFQIAAPLYRQAIATLGADHAACAALRESMEALSRGCHRFANADKAVAYRAARDAASRAAFELALAGEVGAGGRDGAGALLDAVEQDLMAALAGLLRRLDRMARRELVPS